MMTDRGTGKGKKFFSLLVITEGLEDRSEVGVPTGRKRRESKGGICIGGNNLNHVRTSAGGMKEERKSVDSSKNQKKNSKQSRS